MLISFCIMIVLQSPGPLDRLRLTDVLATCGALQDVQRRFHLFRVTPYMTGRKCLSGRGGVLECGLSA